MMLHSGGNIFHVSPHYQPVLRQVGLDAEAVFTHPDIHIWRSIPERENGTLDADLADGKRLRLHIKRYTAVPRRQMPADAEAHGIQLLQAGQIPTVPLVGWGRISDGRSFVITEDLAGYQPADKLLENGFDFARLLGPTAHLAAALHRADLHHRDLYLCHFFIRDDGDRLDVRLIDAGRVRPLPRWPRRRRWMIKDLAQFWYSTLPHNIEPVQRCRWLEEYLIAGGGSKSPSSDPLSSNRSLRRAIERKAAAIARHDQKLRQSQPKRNISIP